MQRLIITLGARTLLRGDRADVPLVDFCELERTLQGLSVGSLEVLAGISHPGYYNIVKGTRRDGVKTLLLAVDALGYEFVLRKKEPLS